MFDRAERSKPLDKISTTGQVLSPETKQRGFRHPPILLQDQLGVVRDQIADNVKSIFSLMATIKREPLQYLASTGPFKLVTPVANRARGDIIQIVDQTTPGLKELSGLQRQNGVDRPQ